MSALKIRMLFAVLALVATGASAQGSAPFAAASTAAEKIGEAYFSAYIARDWDRLEPLLAERGSFADPTAALVFGSVQTTGKVEMLTKFRNGYAAIAHMSSTAPARFSPAITRCSRERSIGT